MLIKSDIRGREVIMNVIPSELEDGVFKFNYEGSDSGFVVDTNTDKGEKEMEDLLASNKQLSVAGRKVKTSDLESRFGKKKKQQEVEED